MIGSTKLGAVRERLRDAVAATADDPLQWLEQRMAAAKNGATAGSDRTEVLESWQRILERAGAERGVSGKPARRGSIQFRTIPGSVEKWFLASALSPCFAGFVLSRPGCRLGLERENLPPPRRSRFWRKDLRRHFCDKLAQFRSRTY